MAGHKRSGKNARVSVGGTPLNHATYNVTWRGDDLDTTDFEDGGVETGIIGVEVAEWECGGDWDAGTNALDDPPGLYPRDDLEDLAFFTSQSDGVFTGIDVARVLSSRNGAQVRGKVTFTANGKSNGDWTPPTGDA